jgi:hypothetical protein
MVASDVAAAGSLPEPGCREECGHQSFLFVSALLFEHHVLDRGYFLEISMLHLLVNLGSRAKKQQERRESCSYTRIQGDQTRFRPAPVACQIDV